MWCWLALAAAHASPHGILTESNAPAQAVYEESYADSLSLVVALCTTAATVSFGTCGVSITALGRFIAS